MIKSKLWLMSIFFSGPEKQKHSQKTTNQHNKKLKKLDQKKTLPQDKKNKKNNIITTNKSKKSPNYVAAALVGVSFLPLTKTQNTKSFRGQNFTHGNYTGELFDLTVGGSIFSPNAINRTANAGAYRMLYLSFQLNANNILYLYKYYGYVPNFASGAQSTLPLIVASNSSNVNATFCGNNSVYSMFYSDVLNSFSQADVQADNSYITVWKDFPGQNNFLATNFNYSSYPTVFSAVSGYQNCFPSSAFFFPTQGGSGKTVLSTVYSIFNQGMLGTFTYGYNPVFLGQEGTYSGKANRYVGFSSIWPSIYNEDYLIYTQGFMGKNVFCFGYLSFPSSKRIDCFTPIGTNQTGCSAAQIPGLNPVVDHKVCGDGTPNCYGSYDGKNCNSTNQFDQMEYSLYSACTLNQNGTVYSQYCGWKKPFCKPENIINGQCVYTNKQKEGCVNSGQGSIYSDIISNNKTTTINMLSEAGPYVLFVFPYTIPQNQITICNGFCYFPADIYGKKVSINSREYTQCRATCSDQEFASANGIICDGCQDDNGQAGTPATSVCGFDNSGKTRLCTGMLLDQSFNTATSRATQCSLYAVSGCANNFHFVSNSAMNNVVVNVDVCNKQGSYCYGLRYINNTLTNATVGVTQCTKPCLKPQDASFFNFDCSGCTSNMTEGQSYNNICGQNNCIFPLDANGRFEAQNPAKCSNDYSNFEGCSSFYNITNPKAINTPQCKGLGNYCEGLGYDQNGVLTTNGQNIFSCLPFYANPKDAASFGVFFDGCEALSNLPDVLYKYKDHMSYNNVCGDDSSVCVGLPVDIQGKFNKNNPVGCKATSCKNCQGCVANELSNTGTTIPLAVTTCPTNKAFCDGLFVESDYCTVEEKEEACFNYCPKNDDCNFPLPMPSAMCEENNSSGACRDPEKTINGFLYTEGKYVCCGISSISDQQTEQCNPSCEGCLGCSETNMLGSCQKNQYVCGVKKPWNCGVSLDKTGKITSSQYDTMYVAPACVESMLSLNANCIKAEYISTELKPQVNSSVNNLLCPSGFFFLSSDFLCKNQALVTQYCSNTPTESSILNTTVCGYLNPYCSTGIIQSGVCSEFSEGGPSRPIIYAITGSTLIVSGVALGLGYYFQKTKKYKQALFASAVFFTSAVVGIIPIFL